MMRQYNKPNDSVQEQLDAAMPIKPEPPLSRSAFIDAVPRVNVGSKMLEIAINNMKNKGKQDVVSK